MRVNSQFRICFPTCNMSVLVASTGRHGRDPVLRGPRHPGTQPPDPGAAGCVLVVLGERQLLRRLVESDVDPAPPHRSLNGRHTPCHRKPSQRSQAQVSAPKPRACSIPATGEGAHAPCWPGWLHVAVAGLTVLEVPVHCT